MFVAQLSYNMSRHREAIMTANALVRARIDGALKDEAASVLSEMGLTISDVVRMTLTRIAKDRALPRELVAPNADTLSAMGEARVMMKRRANRFAKADALFDALDEKAR
jgi:DNA-damage-inducible protein J